MNLDPLPPLVRPARRPPLLPQELRLVLIVAGAVALFLGLVTLATFGLSVWRIVFAAAGATVLSAAWPTRRERSPL